MSVGRLTERLATRVIAWGRCFSVVCAGLDDAEDALFAVADSSDLESLIELEALASERVERMRTLLRDDPEGRPSGPFSSLVLDALSIAALRDGTSDAPFGGWSCYLSEQDALSAACRRQAHFLASSSVRSLDICVQTFSARVGGRFVLQDDLVRHLAAKPANDPDVLADEFALMRDAGIDGILMSDAGAGPSVIVLRGSAVSHVRPAGLFRFQDGTAVPLSPPAEPDNAMPGTLRWESGGHAFHSAGVQR